MPDMDETQKWVRELYSGLWFLLKALLVMAVIAALIFARVAFDGWYVNWLMK